MSVTTTTEMSAESMAYTLHSCEDLLDDEYLSLVLQSSADSGLSDLRQYHDLAWIETTPSSSISLTTALDNDSPNEPETHTVEATSSPPPKKGNPTDAETLMRRRLQNRASQKAFRERKQQHTRSVMRQLEMLEKKHGDLQHSYARQNQVMVELETQIAELNTQLRTLRPQRPEHPSMMSNYLASLGGFGTFDAVTLPADCASYGHGYPQPVNLYGNSTALENPVKFQMQNNPDQDDLLFAYGSV